MLDQIFFLALTALGFAGFSNLFDYATDEGQILEGYFKMINKLGIDSKLWKVLGGCMVCFNFHLSHVGLVFFFCMQQVSILGMIIYPIIYYGLGYAFFLFIDSKA